MNSLSVKTKFQIGRYKSLKQIYSKFELQFDLEGQEVFRIVQNSKANNFFSQRSNTKQIFHHLFHLILHTLHVLEMSPHLPRLSTVIY